MEFKEVKNEESSWENEGILKSRIQIWFLEKIEHFQATFMINYHLSSYIVHLVVQLHLYNRVHQLFN